MSEQGAVGPAASTAGEWWHPTAGVAQALVWLLAAQAAGQLILIPYDSGEPYVRIHRAFDELLKGHDNTAQTLINHAFDGSHRGIIQIVNVIGFAVLVLFAIWGWRSATNARALGRGRCPSRAGVGGRRVADPGGVARPALHRDPGPLAQLGADRGARVGLARPPRLQPRARLVGGPRRRFPARRRGTRLGARRRARRRRHRDRPPWPATRSRRRARCSRSSWCGRSRSASRPNRRPTRRRPHGPRPTSGRSPPPAAGRAGTTIPDGVSTTATGTAARGPST